MNKVLISTLVVGLGLIHQWAGAQLTTDGQSLTAEAATLPRVEVRGPLATAENDLRKLSTVMMRSEDFGQRLAAHQLMEASLLTLLIRPESYDYRFDSLTSITRLAPADNSFRIFTWMVVDPSGNHTYGGIVQRRVPIANTEDAYDYYAIPLRDKLDMVAQIETTPLDNENWLGALYYHPRNSEAGVLSFPGEFYRVNPGTGKTRKEKVTYYVLLGVNNHDSRTNYKIIELIHFDPRDPRKVHFGIPILHFGPTPRMRAVFKYSDNAVFSLNYGLAMDGKRKVPMILFDHLAEPSQKVPQELWSYGSDGTQDGLYFFNQPYELRKGFFGIRRNVVVYDPAMDQYDPAKVSDRSAQERERLRRQGLEYQASRKKLNP